METLQQPLPFLLLLLFIQFPAPKYPGKAVLFLLPAPDILGWTEGVWARQGSPRWMLCVQSSFAGRYTEVKVPAAVIPQEAQRAEQGPLQRDMRGSVGVWQGAWGKECRGNTTRLRALGSGLRGGWACLISFFTSLFPHSAFSPSSNRVTAAGSQQAVFILC